MCTIEVLYIISKHLATWTYLDRDHNKSNLPTSLVLVSAKRTWAGWQAREAKDGYVVLKQFGASFEREGDTGMKTVCGNEKSSQPKTARSN